MWGYLTRRLGVTAETTPISPAGRLCGGAFLDEWLPPGVRAHDRNAPRAVSARHMAGKEVLEPRNA